MRKPKDLRVLEVSVFLCMDPRCPLPSPVHSEIVYDEGEYADGEWVNTVIGQHVTIEKGLQETMDVINNTKAEIR